MSCLARSLPFLVAVTFGCSTGPEEPLFPDEEITPVEETGYVGQSELRLTADHDYELWINWGGAEELYGALTAVPETEDAGRTVRRGSHLVCARNAEGRFECVLRFKSDGTGLLLDAKTAKSAGEPVAKSMSSVWVHTEPVEYVRIKMTSDIARKLITDVFPALDKKTPSEWKNHLRCGFQRSGFGKSGSLTGRAARCWIAFSPAGEPLGSAVLDAKPHENRP